MNTLGLPSFNRPVILTDVINKWPCWLNKSWTQEALLKRAGDRKFRLSEEDPITGKNMLISLSTYWSYTANSSDVDPLYIFDYAFDEHCPILLGDYEVRLALSAFSYSYFYSYSASVSLFFF